ncbi:MAG TPA: hypothetical protein VFS21_19845 [Roseiflexaceae bacterium]|nr:hypothetical protein [Roseiflexaceae bacterium]
MPLTLSVSELTELWSLVQQSTADLVMKVAARWIAPPNEAFIPSDDPRYIQLGWGRKSDGSWAPIGLRHDALRYVMWITAAMGRGKSEYLKQIFRQLLNGRIGFFALDCKGLDLINDTIPLIPLELEGKVAIFDLDGMHVNGDHLIPAMNLLAPEFGQSLGITPDVQASAILNFFAALDPYFEQSPAMQNFAKMALLALIEGEPRATMQHVQRFLEDESYRATVCASIANDQVRDFWLSRFPEMTSTEKGPLTALKRRLDLLLAYPALAAMTVAPRCSINLRELMDTGGILLAGMSAKDGEVVKIGATLLVVQAIMAGLSRTNVSGVENAEGFVDARPDYHLFVDEAHMILNGNGSLARALLSQLRAMRLGIVVVNQVMGQFGDQLLSDLRGVQYRVILGAEMEDATQYASDYKALGLTKEDFLYMEKHKHQRLKFLGIDRLFSARMLGRVMRREEPAPGRVYANWRTILAPARSEEERRLDEAIRWFREVYALNPNAAIRRLGQLCLADPDAYTLYCDRTRAHRLAQRAFILRNPGAIPDKALRVRTLSALWVGVPSLETRALQWALLEQARQARAERAAAEEAEKAGGKRGGRGQGTQSGGRSQAGGQSVRSGVDPVLAMSPTASPAGFPDASTPLPVELAPGELTLEQLLAERDQVLAQRAKRRSSDELDAVAALDL